MVRLIRALSHPLLGAVFVSGGLAVLKDPQARAKVAAPVVHRVASAVPIAPADPVEAVRLNAMLHVGAGAMLAAGILPRLSAAALAGSTVLTTLGGHRFWELSDAQQRAQQRTQFLKNAAILGGLLLAAFD
jgi:putative oxidoreductase